MLSGEEKLLEYSDPVPKPCGNEGFRVYTH